jgi:hypothetical protein
MLGIERFVLREHLCCAQARLPDTSKEAGLLPELVRGVASVPIAPPLRLLFIRHAGDRLRLTCQCVAASSGPGAWSGSAGHLPGVVGTDMCE